MDIEKFGECKTGTLLPIEESAEPLWSFFPDMLPPRKWVMNDLLEELFVEAREYIGILNYIGNELPSPKLLLRPLQRRETLHSSGIEGIQATFEHLLNIEYNQSQNTHLQTIEHEHWRELYNDDIALQYGFDQIRKGRKFDMDFICALHKKLMTSVRGYDQEPGLIREKYALISGGRFIPPPPDKVKECLENLCHYINSDSNDINPLIKAFIAHYQFEAIHPFSDGNGRVGRILLSLIIFRFLYLDYPVVYLSEFFRENKNEYIARMFSVSTDGEWDDWLEFCGRGAIEHLQVAIDIFMALIRLRYGYIKILRNKHEDLIPVMNYLFFEFPFIQVTQAAKILAIPEKVTKQKLDLLIDNNILEPSHNDPEMFIATEVLKVAYTD